jgi:hypothetical protein
MGHNGYRTFFDKLLGDHIFLQNKKIDKNFPTRFKRGGVCLLFSEIILNAKTISENSITRHKNT